jgi:hypothetical protein
MQTVSAAASQPATDPASVDRGEPLAPARDVTHRNKTRAHGQPSHQCPLSIEVRDLSPAAYHDRADTSERQSNTKVIN